MSKNKYTGFDGITIVVDPKCDADVAVDLWEKLDLLKDIGLYKVLRHGILGQDEHQSVTRMFPAPTDPIPDLDSFLDARWAFLSTLRRAPQFGNPNSGFLTEPEVLTATEEAFTLFLKYARVQDDRTTEEEAEAQRAKRQAQREEREQKEIEEFREMLAEYADDTKRIVIPHGFMAVKIAFFYDDHHPTDRRGNARRQYGPLLLLGIVPSGPRTQGVTRRVVGNYPELAKLDLRWSRSYESTAGRGCVLYGPSPFRAKGVTTLLGVKDPKLNVAIFATGEKAEFGSIPYRGYPGQEKDTVEVQDLDATKPDWELPETCQTLNGAVEWHGRRNHWVIRYQLTTRVPESVFSQLMDACRRNKGKYGNRGPAHWRGFVFNTLDQATRFAKAATSAIETAGLP